MYPCSWSFVVVLLEATMKSQRSKRSTEVKHGGSYGQSKSIHLRLLNTENRGSNPLGYTVLVLPLSVVRWTNFANPSRPPLLDSSQTRLATATLVFHSTFRLSGLINVLLIMYTRVGLLLIDSDGELYPDDPRRLRQERRPAQQEEHELEPFPFGAHRGHL